MEELSRLDFHLGKLIWEGKVIPYVVSEMTKRSKGERHLKDGADRKPGGDVGLHSTGFGFWERLSWSKRGSIFLSIFSSIPPRDSVGIIPELGLLRTTNIKEFKRGKHQWLMDLSWVMENPNGTNVYKNHKRRWKPGSYLDIFLKVQIKLSSGSGREGNEKTDLWFHTSLQFSQLN